jgi:hypothetical protein
MSQLRARQGVRISDISVDARCMIIDVSIDPTVTEHRQTAVNRTSIQKRALR